MRILILLILLSGCMTAKELELQRGNCHECDGGWCCEFPINEEKLCAL